VPVVRGNDAEREAPVKQERSRVSQTKGCQISGLGLGLQSVVPEAGLKRVKQRWQNGIKAPHVIALRPARRWVMI